MATSLNFDTFAQEAYEYVNELSRELGHPEEKERTLIIWRAVMHNIRDRIHMGESLQLIAPLPMILKGIYVEDWKFSEKPPKDFDTVEEFKDEVKAVQERYGEKDFPWKKSTEEIISITISSLSRYLKEEQLEHLRDQMPNDLKELVA